MKDFKAPEGFILITKILDPEDPRARYIQISDVIRTKIRGLLELGIFRKILKDFPEDSNVLPCRLFLDLKSTENEKIEFSVRYVIGRHRDKLKSYMVHSSQTLQIHSLRLLLALSVIFGFKIWTSDVLQTFLQSAE